jgi:hypothetical protein
MKNLERERDVKEFNVNEPDNQDRDARRCDGAAMAAVCRSVRRGGLPEFIANL